jgi:Asp-tRNA(Asn)/Glu-tRNA(Gln) amidotransferase A subunit family amidase
MNVCAAPAIELAGALRRRELSAVELLEAVLARCDAAGPAINPFSVRLDDRARASAAAADVRLAAGSGRPLEGIPVTVKDSQWMAGIESAQGSLALAGHVPTESCAPVERLEAAGAVIFAKTTTPEMCYSGITESPLHGITRNPWDLDRTCGGSSGGSAAAVAAGLGPLSLGGDGGGSIRIPAAFCGVVGFKPTFGLVPREPCGDTWKTLVSVGPLARSVADARLMLEAVAGPDPRDRHSLLAPPLAAARVEAGRLRLAVSADLGHAPVDADVAAAFGELLHALAEEGVELVEDDPGLGSSVETWATVAAASARWSLTDAWEHSRHVMTERARDLLAYGESITTEAYLAAERRREEIHAAYAALFARTGAAALVTPALGCQAFGHGVYHPGAIAGVDVGPPLMDWAGFLYDANLAGLPACAVPVGLGADGLPVAAQVLGPRGADGVVLAVAEVVERVSGFARLRPPARELLAG